MHHDDEKSGFIFLMALFVLTGLASVMAVGLTRTMTEQLAARTEVANHQAFHLAEAGIDEALNALNAPGPLATPPWVPTDGDGDAQTKSRDPDDYVERTYPRGSPTELLNVGDVQIQIFAWEGLSPRVVVRASTPSITRRLEVVLLDLEPWLRHALASTIWGASAGMTIGQWSEVDSYDSRIGIGAGPLNQGHIASATVPSATENSILLEAAGIGSPPKVSGYAEVPAAGLVRVKPPSGLSTDCKPEPDPTADDCYPQLNQPVRTLSGPFLNSSSYTQVAVPNQLETLAAGSSNLGSDTTILPGSYSAFVLADGRDVTLVGGTPDNPALYEFDTLEVKNGSRLTVGPNAIIHLSKTKLIGAGFKPVLSVAADSSVAVTGRTELYFHGDIDFRENTITQDVFTSRPENLVMYGVTPRLPGTAPPTISIGGSGFGLPGRNVSFTGVIFAPGDKNPPPGYSQLGGAWLSVSSDIDPDDGRASKIFGSIVAAQISISNGSRVHYDVALQGLLQRFFPRPDRYRIRSWRELD